MTQDKHALLLAIQSLQKRGLCRNLDACEYVRDYVDLSHYAHYTAEERLHRILADAQAHADAQAAHN